MLIRHFEGKYQNGKFVFGMIFALWLSRFIDSNLLYSFPILLFVILVLQSYQICFCLLKQKISKMACLKLVMLLME